MIVTGIYGAILVLFLMRLTLRVVKLRRRHRVSLGDGGVDELQQAISAHNNAAQYIPLALILMFILEYQQLPTLLIHLAGVTFVVGRWIHAVAITSTNFKKRVIGMQLTVWTLIALSVINLLWPVYRFIVG